LEIDAQFSKTGDSLLINLANVSLLTKIVFIVFADTTPAPVCTQILNVCT